MIPVWLFWGSLSLGLPNIVLSVLVPLKCTWIPFLLHNFWNFPLFQACMAQLWWCSFCCCCCCLVGCCCCLVGWGWWTFDAIGWGPNLEIGTGVMLTLYVGSSLSSWSCVEVTTLALCASMLNTLCLAVMWWLLSQCRYWSVWVGFLYTKVLNVLFCCMVTRVSRDGSEPCCVGSTVNCMWGSWLLMCCRSAWLCSALLMTKVSSTNLSQREGGWGWN